MRAARGRRQARSSARLAGRALRHGGQAGGASGALESTVSHGSGAARKNGWSRSGGGAHARFWCEVEGCYPIDAVPGRAGSCRFQSLRACSRRGSRYAASAACLLGRSGLGAPG
ncbi:hypothetical protein DF018_25585 [Burkholderia cenocepacia]|nr:hypothetical protein DF132_22955 [Burkholderia cenocepacia]RQV63136.1 hypothetical protein DF018_25585 [Burkholderia cenocepacia]